MTKNYLQGEILAKIMITEKKFGQKKNNQQGMIMAEQLINKE